jgi:YesN/AraC family two-component response regulator
MEKKRVLIVDDEVAFRTSLDFILQKNDFEVEEAENGQEALDKISEGIESGNPFALLITDLSMPDVSGFALLAALQEKNLEIKTIVISAYWDDEIHSKPGFASNAIFLSKPLDEEKINSCTQQLLGNNGTDQ